MQLLCGLGKMGLEDLCGVSARWLGLHSPVVSPLDQIALCESCEDLSDSLLAVLQAE